MARGDTEKAFRSAAARDGVVLVRARVPWLNERGHFGLPDSASAVRPILASIFTALGGLEQDQAAKRLRSLPGDFFHEASGTFVEVDEHQHFTSFRRATLELYPDDAALGFEIAEYRALCDAWSPKADRYYASKAAVGFGTGGRQRQRAYNDALRDLATPALGHPGVIRVAAPERNGAAAYERVRDRMTALRDV